MKEIYIFIILVILTNIFIAYYIINKNFCIEYSEQLYIIIFYISIILYIAHLYYYYYYYKIEDLNELDSTIIINLINNKDYIVNSDKIIYWFENINDGSYNNFNNNGIVDIIDNKVSIPYSSIDDIKKYVIKYRVIKNNVLSDVYTFKY
jgi:hypothetical protein